MKKSFLNGVAVGLLAVCLCACASVTSTAERSGHLEIGNENLRLVLPDPTLAEPYYQAHRFTLPGMVVAAEWKGIQVFKEIGSPRDPLVHNHVGGTAEEFDINGPADYDKTPVGGSFMKIGVGLLQRVEDVPYRFSHSYPMVKAPINQVERIDGQTLKFIQTLEDTEGARGYELVLYVQVQDSGFSIERRLTNLGESPIETEHYSHNFSQIGGKPVDAAYGVHWTTPVAIKDAIGEGMRASPTGVTFSNDLPGRYYVASEPGIGLPANEPLLLSHTSLGLEMSITNDLPLYRLAVFGREDLICPEPFVKMTVPPAGSIAWKTTSTFKDLAPASAANKR